MNDPKGSNWRKWDLHVHSPASKVQHYGTHDSDETWENFVRDLEELPLEFKVIGINDYNFIDGYRKVLDFKRSGRLANIDLILPVVELRIDKFVGTDDWRRINLHVIFSEELSPDEIQAQFLDGIQSSYQLSPQYLDDTSVRWDGTHKPESIIELGAMIRSTVPETEGGKFQDHLDVGFNNLNCDFKAVKNLLRSSRFENKHLIAIGKGEWDQMKWTPQSVAAKKSFINEANFIFSAAISIDAYQKGKDVLDAQSVILDSCIVAMRIIPPIHI